MRQAETNLDSLDESRPLVIPTESAYWVDNLIHFVDNLIHFSELHVIRQAVYLVEVLFDGIEVRLERI